MPTITKIAQQRRRQNRYSIYVDGSYKLSLSELALVDAGLRNGDTITEEQLEHLEATAEIGTALDKAYNYIALRPRSRQELTIYLRRKKYDGSIIHEVASHLEQHGLLNDEHFAVAWVEERLLLQPRSRQQLKAELRQKGIAMEAIEAALQSVNNETEATTVRKLIQTKRLLSRYDDERKLIQHLATKGFRYDSIRTALDQIENDADSS